ncbi:hypothetical protein [Psychrobacter sp. I-STPA6b]|uniref:hypothetical protein n=1 Tax=Psychrobacter sp. I-STPA6b TaxID=2585718 RepID=UPI001D0C57E6|nr:hypothetical protein [Psychrobacter sp. I-STPA6b]
MWESVKYDADSYCCEHFLVDAYRHYTDIDLTPKLLTRGFFNVRNLRNFKQVSEPRQYTIVLLRSRGKAHVGLWVNGRVLHLDNKGVVWQSLDIVKQGFERVLFYEIV